MPTLSLEDMHLKTLKDFLGESVLLLEPNLDQLGASDARTLVQILNQDQYKSAYLAFKSPHLERENAHELNAAIEALASTPALLESFKKSILELSEMKKKLDVRLAEDLSFDVLYGLASGFEPKKIEKLIGEPFVFPPKLLIWDDTSKTYQRLTLSEYIRQQARKKLEDKCAASRKNFIGILNTPAQAHLDHLKRIETNDLTLIKTVQKIRNVANHTHSFFSESIEKKLLALSEAHFLWMTPAFQASAGMHARHQLNQYRRLTESTQTLMHHLEEQRWAVLERLLSLPEPADLAPGFAPEFNTLLIKHRQRLTEELHKIDEDLRVPSLILEKLLGSGRLNDSPLACKGILSSLEEAALKKTGLHFLNTVLHVSYQDYDQDRLPKDLKPNVHLTTLSDGHVSLASAGDTFKEVLRVPLDKVRVYETSVLSKPPSSPGQPPIPAQVVGRFTETRLDDYRRPNHTLTVLTFPSSTDRQPPPNGRDLHEERVEFAMAMMLQKLANLEHEPSEAHPIRISGKNEIELKYLTLAAVVIQEMMGKKLKAALKAVEVHSGCPKDFPSVNWKQHLGIESSGMFFKHNDPDGYYENFKNSPHVKGLQKTVQSLTQQKFLSSQQAEKLRSCENSLLLMSKRVTDQRGKRAYSPPLVRTP